MSATAASPNPFEAHGLPVPLDLLASVLDPAEGFTEGALRCARFFHTVGNEYSAQELFTRLLDPSVPKKWLEHVLFCIVDAGFSQIQASQHVLRLKCLRRLYMRRSAGVTLSTREEDLVRETRSRLHIDDVLNLMACSVFARKVASLMFRRMYVHESHRSLVVFLIKAEAEALQIRVERLSTTVDVSSVSALRARLPIIRLFERSAEDALRLAATIEGGQTPGRSSMTFADEFGGARFEALLMSIENVKELRLLHSVLTLQWEKLVPTRELVALSSVCRWVDEARGTKFSILGWMHAALTVYDQGRFRVEMGSLVEALRPAIENAGAWVEGTAITGSFSNRLYTQWIGHDMLTRPLHMAAKGEAEPDGDDEKVEEEVKELVRMHVGNDALIVRLLDTPKVYTTPGLVTFVAMRSRSVAVLSKIASRNDLYSGAANAGVPRALLANPSPIPLSLLRKFYRPSFFSVRDLHTLVSASSRMRSEVVKEIAGYIESA